MAQGKPHFNGIERSSKVCISTGCHSIRAGDEWSPFQLRGASIRETLSASFGSGDGVKLYVLQLEHDGSEGTGAEAERR